MKHQPLENEILVNYFGFHLFLARILNNPPTHKNCSASVVNIYGVDDANDGST
jgi:hypothetical protein